MENSTVQGNAQVNNQVFKNPTWRTTAPSLISKSYNSVMDLDIDVKFVRRLKSVLQSRKYACCFQGIIQFQSLMKTFYTTFHIDADNRYPKVIHMSKLIFYDARRRMATAMNLVLQQTWQRINFFVKF